MYRVRWHRRLTIKPAIAFDLVTHGLSLIPTTHHRQTVTRPRRSALRWDEPHLARDECAVNRRHREVRQHVSRNRCPVCFRSQLESTNFTRS